MLEVIQAKRSVTVARLMTAVAQMVAELDPAGLRDHRSLWELPLKERAHKPDLFDRVRFAADELAVISAQLVAWKGGTNGPERTLAAAVGLFGRLLEREQTPIVSLEHDVPALQFQRVSYPDLRAAELPKAVKAVRYEHDRACGCLELLEHLAA